MVAYTGLRPPRVPHGRQLFGLGLVAAAISASQGYGTLATLIAASLLWAGCGLIFMNASLTYHEITDRSAGQVGALLSVVFTGIPVGALFVILGQQAAVRWMTITGLVAVTAGVLVTEHVHQVTATDRSSPPDTDEGDTDGSE